MVSGERKKVQAATNDKRPPNLVELFLILVISAALAIFILWLFFSVLGIQRFVSLPPYITGGFHQIWIASVGTGIGGGVLLVYLRSRRRKTDCKPNYAKYLVISTLAILILPTTAAVINLAGCGKKPVPSACTETDPEGNCVRCVYSLDWAHQPAFHTWFVCEDMHPGHRVLSQLDATPQVERAKSATGAWIQIRVNIARGVQDYWEPGGKEIETTGRGCPAQGHSPAKGFPEYKNGLNPDGDQCEVMSPQGFATWEPFQPKLWTVVPNNQGDPLFRKTVVQAMLDHCTSPDAPDPRCTATGKFTIEDCDAKSRTLGSICSTVEPPRVNDAR